MDPKALLTAIVLVALLIWVFIEGGWKSASGVLLIVLTIIQILGLFGLW